MDFPLLIFTDLDGTLLDHDSYSFKGAEGALQRLHGLAIPLILTSSKTRAELQALQQKLGLMEPFIAENGGGVFIPTDYTLLDTGLFERSGDYCCKKFGKPYPFIRKIFEKIRAKYKIRGFGDMTVEEIMAATGLDKKDAILARQRDFSEPFQFHAEQRLQELQKELAGHDLTITRGGRFFHLLASGQDKGRAVAETTRLFQAGRTERLTTVGLGDAENDFAMLRTVDIPVLMPKPDGSYENMNLPGLRKAPYPGSNGWGTAITTILNNFQTAGFLKKTL